MFRGAVLFGTHVMKEIKDKSLTYREVPVGKFERTIQSHRLYRGTALKNRSWNSPVPTYSGFLACASYRSASRP